jgi:hypothetical protein
MKTIWTIYIYIYIYRLKHTFPALNTNKAWNKNSLLLKYQDDAVQNLQRLQESHSLTFYLVIITFLIFFSLLVILFSLSF